MAAQLQDAQTHGRALSEQLTSAIEDRLAKERLANTMKEERDLLKTKLAELEEEKKNWSRRSADWDCQRSALETEVLRLKEVEKRQIEDFNCADAASKALKEQLDLKNSTIERLEDCIEDLEAEVESAKAHAEQLAADYQTLESENNQLEEEVAEQIAQAVAAKQKNNQLEQQMDLMVQPSVHAGFVSELASARKEIELLKTGLGQKEFQIRASESERSRLC